MAHFIPLPATPLVTRIEHYGKGSDGRVETLTDQSIDIKRSFIVTPWSARKKVAAQLLGWPRGAWTLQTEDGSTTDSGGPQLPGPEIDPDYPNTRCVKVVIRPTSQDVSYAAGLTAPQNAPPFSVVPDSNHYLSGGTAMANAELYQAAIIDAYYTNKPEWRIETRIVNKNFSLPTHRLKWKNVKLNGGDAPLGLVGAGSNAVDAIKTDSYVDIVFTPFRHPADGRQLPLWNTWSALAGRINRDEWRPVLRSGCERANTNVGIGLVNLAFAPETLMFIGLVNTMDYTTLTSQEPAIAGLPIAFDYWQHSFLFQWKTTTAESATEFVGAAPDPYPSADAIAFLEYPERQSMFPGWNRFWYPGDGSAVPTGAGWDYAIDDTGEKVYRFAEDISLSNINNGARSASGFDLLFNWL